MKSITVQPLSCQFSNENKAMGLRPHQHYAEVTLTFQTLGALGFPVFADTVGALHDLLGALTLRPFRDSTNEDVADKLFRAFSVLVSEPTALPPEGCSAAWERARGLVTSRGGEYRLSALELAVRGVPDDIGHSDGFARYAVVT